MPGWNLGYLTEKSLKTHKKNEAELRHVLVTKLNIITCRIEVILE